MEVTVNVDLTIGKHWILARFDGLFTVSTINTRNGAETHWMLDADEYLDMLDILTSEFGM